MDRKELLERQKKIKEELELHKLEEDIIKDEERLAEKKKENSPLNKITKRLDRLFNH